MKILGKQYRDETILVNMFRAGHKNLLVVCDDKARIDYAKRYDLSAEELKRVFTFFDVVEERKKLIGFEKICIGDADKLLSCMFSSGQEIIAVAM